MCELNHTKVTYHNVAPLVESEGQVSVRLDPLGVRRVHDCLAGGADGDWLSKLGLARPGNPGNLQGEKNRHVRPVINYTFYVYFLCLLSIFNEKGKLNLNLNCLFIYISKNMSFSNLYYSLFVCLKFDA